MGFYQGNSQPLSGQPKPAQSFVPQADIFVPNKKPAQTPAPVQVTPLPPAPKVVEDPVVNAVEKAGIKATHEDIKKIKELIARLNTATGDERVRALKDVKGIASITNTMPAEQSFSSGQLNSECNLIKLEKPSFTKVGAQQPRHDGKKGA
jgi:hypothetical protein